MKLEIGRSGATPLILEWIENKYHRQEYLFLVMDRSQWRDINLLMVSLVYNRRAIPLYFKLLPKKENSNLTSQKEALEPVISLLKDYKLVVLGDRGGHGWRIEFATVRCP